MNKIEKAQAILQAMKEGKTIQFRFAGIGEWKDRVDNKTGFPDFNVYEYRIKPEPVTRLLTVDELPDVIWIKWKSQVRQVIGVGDGLLFYSDGPTVPSVRCSIEELHSNGVLWSGSRMGPWKSFETSEEEK